jgi:hypothetical protein
LKAVFAPQGNPWGRGLSVRKSGNSGAARVPSAEFPFVVFCGSDAVMAVITLKIAEVRPMLIDFAAN